MKNKQNLNKVKYVLEINFANKLLPLLLKYNNSEDCKTELLRINEARNLKRRFLLIYKDNIEHYINVLNIAYIDYYIDVEK